MLELWVLTFVFGGNKIFASKDKLPRKGLKLTCSGSFNMPLIIIVVLELAFTFRFHESIMRLFKPHQHTFPDLSSVFISFIQIFFFNLGTDH